MKAGLSKWDRHQKALQHLGSDKFVERVFDKALCAEPQGVLSEKVHVIYLRHKKNPMVCFVSARKFQPDQENAHIHIRDQD